MFICSLERPISPQASMGFKNWENDAIVGRLCQTFCKKPAQKITATKTSLNHLIKVIFGTNIKARDS